MAEEEENTWACEACTFENRQGASACDICGTRNPRGCGKSSSSDGNAADGGVSAYWSCKACTMQNPSGAFTCHLCSTVDEDQRTKVQESGDGGEEDGVSPALLERLAKDGHFSLQTYLTKLCHTLALAAAEADAGMSRPSIDKAYIPILLELMSNPTRVGGPDVPLQACRALNYFLQIGAASEVGAQRGVRLYALCITCAAAAGTAEFQELGQEAVCGLDLLCRSSLEYLRELADTDIGEGGARVLASFVRAVYRSPPSSNRRLSGASAVSPTTVGLTRGIGMEDDDRGSGAPPATAGAEAAVTKAFALLSPLLDLHSISGRVSGAGGAIAMAGVDVGDWVQGRRGGTSVDGDLEAVIGALLAALRRGSLANREAALSALGSKVLPRLEQRGDLGGTSTGGGEGSRGEREWLRDLIMDEGLLFAVIADHSPRAVECCVRALGLAYRLLASSPELMSLALKAECPLLLAVLGVLDSEGGGFGWGGGVHCGSGGADRGRGSAGVDLHTRRDSTSSVGSVTNPGTPRLGPRTPRLSGKSGTEGKGVLEGEALGRSGLAAV
ncbi:unnamed protein product, partial [Choristocarpus tenellus]